MASPYSHIVTARMHLAKLIEELYDNSSIHVDPEVYANVEHAIKLLDRALASMSAARERAESAGDDPALSGPAQT